MSKIVQLKDQEGDSLYPKVLEEYSSTEKVVGRWVDNKPLYRKIISGNMSQGTTAHGISNIESVAKLYGVMHKPNSGKYFSLPSTRPSYPEYAVGVFMDATYLNLERGSNVQANYMTFKIIIEYTKTTD